MRTNSSKLIEFFIVAGVVSILAFFAIPNFAAMQVSSRNDKVVYQALSLQQAVEEYYLIYQQYPANMLELVKANLLVAKGFENPFTGNFYLPSVNHDNYKLGEIVYQTIDINQDQKIESYRIIAYGKQYNDLSPVACLQER